MYIRDVVPSGRMENTARYVYQSLTEWLNPGEARTARNLAHANRISDTAKRIYHIHIRKTGGTSLNNAFFALSGQDPSSIQSQLAFKRDHRVIAGDMVFVGYNKYLINKGNYTFAHSHIPVYELELPDDTFTVTCFRDPVSRVISHYAMLVNIVQRDSSHPLRETECKWLGDGIQGFLRQLPRQHLLNQLYMYSSEFDVDQALNNARECSYFFFTESHSNGIEELNRLFDINLESFNFRKSDRSGLDIDDGDLALLREILDDEYVFLEKLCKFTPCALKKAKA